MIITAKASNSADTITVAGFSANELNYVLSVLQARKRADEAKGDEVSAAIHRTLWSRLWNAVQGWTASNLGSGRREELHAKVCKALADAYANGIPKY